jgi:hypothetical protein
MHVKPASIIIDNTKRSVFHILTDLVNNYQSSVSPRIKSTTIVPKYIKDVPPIANLNNNLIMETWFSRESNLQLLPG